MARLIRQDNDAVIEFSDDLMPQDEFNWSKVVANQRYTIDGTLIVQQAERKTGKPFTLQAPDDMAWLPRQKVELLQAWADVIGLKFWYERTANNKTVRTGVAFDHSQEPMNAKPVKEFNSPNPTDPFNVTLRLIEI